MKLLYSSNFTIQEFIKANKNIKYDLLEGTDLQDYSDLVPLQEVFIFVENQLKKKPLHRLFFIKNNNGKVFIEDSLTKDKEYFKNNFLLSKEIVLFSKIFQDFKLSKKVINKKSYLLVNENKITLFLYKLRKYYIFLL